MYLSLLNYSGVFGPNDFHTSFCKESQPKRLHDTYFENACCRSLGMFIMS